MNLKQVIGKKIILRKLRLRGGNNNKKLKILKQVFDICDC